MFAFHHINADQDDSEIVVDLCTYPDSSIQLGCGTFRRPRRAAPDSVTAQDLTR